MMKKYLYNDDYRTYTREREMDPIQVNNSSPTRNDYNLKIRLKSIQVSVMILINFKWKCLVRHSAPVCHAWFVWYTPGFFGLRGLPRISSLEDRCNPVSWFRTEMCTSKNSLISITAQTSSTKNRDLFIKHLFYIIPGISKNKFEAC